MYKLILGGIKNEFIEIKGDEIYILCSPSNEKLKKITIHAESNNKMKELIFKLSKILNYEIVIKKFNYIKKNENLLKNMDWYEMPEFKQNINLFKYPKIYLNFDYNNCKDIILKFSKLINIPINEKTSFFWYEKKPLDLKLNKNKMFITEKKYIPKYPIYIISKGRWKQRKTSKYLESCNIDYKIVIEKSEFEEYSKYIDKKKILILPEKYMELKRKKIAGGGIPARNFVWEHSIANGYKKHWILDDNIDGYYRLNNSERVYLKSGCAFSIVEDYVDRYTNIKMAGHNYFMFGMSPGLKPIIKNTRIYSSILIDNDLPFRWRGFYNEDTDLSLRILKKGFATCLFNAILANKEWTGAGKGGNKDNVYSVKDAMYLKAKSIKDQHPDVAKIIKKYNKYHHYIDYTPFKHIKYIFKKKIILKNNVNNYGMKLVKLVKFHFKN